MPLRDPPKDAKESMQNALAFASIDWASFKQGAWLYGIILGWDEESLQEIAAKFDWSNETLTRLKRYQQQFEAWDSSNPPP